MLKVKHIIWLLLTPFVLYLIIIGTIDWYNIFFNNMDRNSTDGDKLRTLAGMFTLIIGLGTVLLIFSVICNYWNEGINLNKLKQKTIKIIKQLKL